MRSTRLALLEGHVNRARWYVGVAMLLMLSLILVAGRADPGTAAACEGGGVSLVVPGPVHEDPGKSCRQGGYLPEGARGGGRNCDGHHPRAGDGPVRPHHEGFLL